MENRAGYVLILVFPIPSKSLKKEIVVAVDEYMEHLLTPKLRPKALQISQTPREVPVKVTFFFEQNWKYHSILFSSEAGL